ncbi:MAG: TrbI/VirB10 family protein [Acidobacteriota bacterium]|nr:TrbI/VirB10 family protein [Acidobacteriota bacterium]
MSATDTQGAAPVVDRRPVPRGVLPKGIQTWLMVALALGIVLIIFFTGQPQAPERSSAASPAQQAVSPDRVRDYQERLSALNGLSAPELRGEPSLPPAFQDDVQLEAVDPLAGERQRRDYESLFASNVVVSRRAPLQRPDARADQSGVQADERPRLAGNEPSLDAIADAVVRATTRNSPQEVAASPASENASVPGATRRVAANAREYSIVAGNMHRIVEGTIIDTVLTNRLDGAAASPVNCLVTNPVYSQNGQHILVPAGARVLGETRQVEGLNDTRLAVGFHRVVMPDGQSVALDQFRGLNQRGDSGLKDRVNQHYWSTFGAAAAVGLVGGLSQWLGSAALGSGDGDRTVIVAGSADAASQASAQSLNRFLNRMPTITIREGHRVKVYVTSDLELPAWSAATTGVDQER